MSLKDWYKIEVKIFGDRKKVSDEIIVKLKSNLGGDYVVDPKQGLIKTKRAGDAVKFFFNNNGFEVDLVVETVNTIATIEGLELTKSENLPEDKIIIIKKKIIKKKPEKDLGPVWTLNHNNHKTALAKRQWEEKKKIFKKYATANVVIDNKKKSIMFNAREEIVGKIEEEILESGLNFQGYTAIDRVRATKPKPPEQKKDPAWVLIHIEGRDSYKKNYYWHDKVGVVKDHSTEIVSIERPQIIFRASEDAINKIQGDIRLLKLNESCNTEIKPYKLKD